MPVYRDDDPLVERQVVEEPVVERRVVEEPVVQRRVVRRARRGPVGDRGDDMATYAFIKYGFILAMTIVILYFIARILLPALL